MKKRNYSAAFLAAMAGMIAWSYSAEAQELTFKPYVGFDVQRSVYSYNDDYDVGGGLVLDGDSILEDSVDGFNIHVGNRFHKYFGGELSYFHSRAESRNVSAGTIVGPGTIATTDFETKVQTQGFTLDALGYLPVTDSGQFELIGTAGVSWTKAKIKIDGESADESEFGLRAGAGAQVNFTDNINLRGLVRYQTADFDDVAERAWIYSAGLNYTF